MKNANRCGFPLVLSAALLVTTTLAKAETAGVVVAVSGEAYAMSVVKQRRALTRGANIDTGDTLYTGSDSKVLLRMTDNTAVAVHESSEYKISQYHYNPSSPASNSNRTSFVKGSMRVLTGAISKEHPEKFEITTPAAVIGVRGTEFSIRYACAGAGSCRLMVLARRGLVTVSNAAGSTTLTAGRFAEVFGPKDVPKSKPAPNRNLCF